MSTRAYLAFLPWIVFALVGRRTLEGAAWGGIAACVTAVVITMLSARVRSWKSLEVFSVALFAGLAVAGAFQQHHEHGSLQRYHNAVAVGALAVFALGSLARVPFTRPYAREIVPRRYWRSARFERANAEVTLAWAVVFVAIAASESVGPAIGTRLGATIFGWMVPVVLVLAGVRHVTTRWADDFDGETLGLDAVLHQAELWELGAPRGRSGRDSSVA